MKITGQAQFTKETKKIKKSFITAEQVLSWRIHSES